MCQYYAERPGPTGLDVRTNPKGDIHGKNAVTVND